MIRRRAISALSLTSLSLASPAQTTLRAQKLHRRMETHQFAKPRTKAPAKFGILTDPIQLVGSRMTRRVACLLR